MTYSSMPLLLLSLIALFFQASNSSTITFDGFSEWKNPSVLVGDTVIFQHRFHYDLFVFRNQRAYSLCNFTQSSLLTKSNSTSFTWHPSRPGFFYFAFNNGSAKPCQSGQKLAVKVSVSASPAIPPASAPAPSSGGSFSSSPSLALPPVGPRDFVPSSPSRPWPFQPRDTDSSPGPAPSAVLPATSPLVPDKNSGIPSINSNPAVPLPTGEVDSATIRPLPTSSAHHEQVVGILAVKFALSCVFLMMAL